MKRLAISVAVATLVLTGCGSTSKSTDKIVEQKLSTSFVSEDIKIETKCAWFGMSSECNIVAIEATGTAPSFGGTVNNRRNALTRAELRAKASVAEFLDTQVSSTRVQTTLAKNIEKASDKVRSGNDNDQPVAKNSKIQGWIWLWPGGGGQPYDRGIQLVGCSIDHFLHRSSQ